MQETRFALTLDGLEIPAVLTVPAAPRAALLLIPGSLNSDVDGNYAPMFPGQAPMVTNLYRDLAAQWAAHGIAVLRFAKSGPGTGAVVRDEPLFRERYRTFPQRIVVAGAFLDHIVRRQPGLPLALAGHSEGAVVATCLAQSRRDVTRLVLLSGPSKPLLHLMIWQTAERERAAGRATPEHEKFYLQGRALAQAYAAGEPIPAVPADNPFTGMVPFFLTPEARPYLQSVEQVDPAAELARVTQPVLIVQGGRDFSVDAPNAECLRQAQPRAQIAFFPELQHFYKHSPADIEPMASMLVQGDADPAVAAAVAAFIAPTRAST